MKWNFSGWWWEINILKSINIRYNGMLNDYDDEYLISLTRMTYNDDNYYFNLYIIN